MVLLANYHHTLGLTVHGYCGSFFRLTSWSFERTRVPSMVPTTPGKPTTPKNKFDAFGLMRPVETLWVILETAD